MPWNLAFWYLWVRRFPSILSLDLRCLWLWRPEWNVHCCTRGIKLHSHTRFHTAAFSMFLNTLNPTRAFRNYHTCLASTLHCVHSHYCHIPMAYVALGKQAEKGTQRGSEWVIMKINTNLKKRKLNFMLNIESSLEWLFHSDIVMIQERVIDEN